MGSVRREGPADTSIFTAYLWEVSGERVRRTLPMFRLTYGKCPARGPGGHFQFYGLLLGSVRRAGPADTFKFTAYSCEVSGDWVWRTLPMNWLTFGKCPASGPGGHFHFYGLLMGSVRREGPADTSNSTAYLWEVSSERVRRTCPILRLAVGKCPARRSGGHF